MTREQRATRRRVQAACCTEHGFKSDRDLGRHIRQIAAVVDEAKRQKSLVAALAGGTRIYSKAAPRLLPGAQGAATGGDSK